MIKIVKELKDTKGVLLWNLGNENNYTFSGKIGYWTFLKKLKKSLTQLKN
jgi:hypothetical protein